MSENTAYIKTKRSLINNPYILYSLLFLITAGLSFSAFIIYKQTMIIDPDGYLQHYPMMVKTRHIIKETMTIGSFPFWSWDTGLGADTIGNYGFLLFDPFTYIPALFFKAEHMDIGCSVGYVIKLYAAGWSFIWFYRSEEHDDWKCVVGGISYALCAWSIGSMMHAFFIYPMVLLPVIVKGINKAYRKESPATLIVSVFLMLIFSWYFTYMTGIMMAIYAVVRFSDYKGKEFFAAYLKLFGYVVIAVLLSAAVSIVTLYALINASKEASTSQGFLHSLKSYLLIPASFFANNEIFGNYSFTAINGFFILLIPEFFRKEHRKKPAVIMWMICLVFLLLPIFCRMLNGFSYASGRWMFIMAFFCIWAGLEVVDTNAGKYRAWAIFAVLIFVVDVLLLRVLYIENIIIYLINCMIACLEAVLIARKNEKETGPIINKRAALLICVCINIVLVNIVHFSHTFGTGLDKTMEEGLMYRRMKISAQEAAAEIPDESLYRTYYARNPQNFTLMHVPVNDNAFWGTKIIYGYLSTLDHKWHDFNKTVCNSAGYSQRISVYGNDNRARLDFLEGVKYFIGDSKLKEPDMLYDHEEVDCVYAGYGYEKYGLFDDTEVLINNNNIGLGALFDKVISRSEFEELSYIQKEEALMQAAVIEDEDLDDSMGSKISAADLSFSGKPLQISLDGHENTTIEGKRITAEADGSFVINTEQVDNSEVYIFFYGLKRIVPESTDAFSEKQYPSFDIYINDDTKTKRIANYSGTNQAFAEVEDYCVNMGVYDGVSCRFRVRFLTAGEYTFDRIEVMSLPVSSYDSQAQVLQARRFIVDSYDSNNVKGHIDADTNGILYLSILNNPGWKAYVNGEEKDVIVTDVAFSGIPLERGENDIELRYHPPYFTVGVMGSLLGLAAFIIVIVRSRISQKRNRA